MDESTSGRAAATGQHQAAEPTDAAAAAADSNAKPPGDQRQRRWQRWLLIAAASTVGALLVAAVSVTALHHSKQRGRRRRGRSGGQGADGGQSSEDGSSSVRIPLKEVVRFKERQWFLEDLEASRQGDSNAMLRVAKMYLHGQGCTQSLGMATEWLRKARAQGMYGSLEELWAGDAEELERLRQGAARAAAVARRRAVEAQQIRPTDEAPWVPSAR